MSAVLPRQHFSSAASGPDSSLLLATLALVMLGLVMVSSTSIAIAEAHGVGPFHYVSRHAMFLIIGAIGAAIMWRVPLALLQRWSPLAALAALGLLLLVFLPGIGMRINGARRWINLGISGFQVVELVKLLLIIFMAGYLARHRQALQSSWAGLFKPLILLGALVGLLLAQPDFGGAVLLIGIAVGMLWLGGASAPRLIGVALAGLPVIAIVAQMESYRMRRLTSFLNPWEDPFKDGFQLTQALIAVGRGEWFGVGLGDSVQKLFYLPEAHTDFIVAVIAEELGFFGLVLLLGLFALLAGRAFKLGLSAFEREQVFAGSVAYGIGLWFALQAVISIGVNLGVLPTKGLTLPFVSSGGSSVLMSCVAIGLLLRVARELAEAEAESLRPPRAPRVGMSV